CDGFHLAYVMVKYHDAGFPAIAHATVLQGTGWNTFGWTLVLVYKDKKGRKFHVIYGHLNRNPIKYLKVCHNVKLDKTIMYKESSPTSNKVVTPSKPKTSNKKVNKNKNRGRSLTAYFSGRIDSLGAEVRKRRGNQSIGFNWNEKSGYDLKPGDVVYIFEVHNG